MGDSDEELIIEYLKGNEQAFKMLVEKYTPHLYNFARRFVGASAASDIAQDAFIKIWKKYKNLYINTYYL